MVFLRSCGGVLVVVFVWWSFCSGVFVMVIVWWCLCGEFLWWCFCGGVVVFVRWCFSSHQNKGSMNQGCHQNHSIGTCSVDLSKLYLFETSGTASCGTTGIYRLFLPTGTGLKLSDLQDV